MKHWDKKSRIAAFLSRNVWSRYKGLELDEKWVSFRQASNSRSRRLPQINLQPFKKRDASKGILILLLKHLLVFLCFRLNQAVFSIFSAVDDICVSVDGIREDEKVVTEHVHLQNRFFGVHRFQIKPLCSDNL